MSNHLLLEKKRAKIKIKILYPAIYSGGTCTRRQKKLRNWVF